MTVDITQNKGEATQNIAIPENVKKVKNEMEKLGLKSYQEVRQGKWYIIELKVESTHRKEQWERDNLIGICRSLNIPVYPARYSTAFVNGERYDFDLDKTIIILCGE
jgi:phosphoribosylformylglycinamidine (FGAM) synthase PurS component